MEKTKVNKVGLQVAVPADLSRSVREYIRQMPGVSLSSFGQAALENWLEKIEAEAFSATMLGGRKMVKAPGEPFPRRPHGATRRGGPLKGEARSSVKEGGWEGLKLYVPKELSERLKNASFWRAHFAAWDVAEALSEQIERDARALAEQEELTG